MHYFTQKLELVSNILQMIVGVLIDQILFGTLVICLTDKAYLKFSSATRLVF